jgi:glycosyltransferase involved in cell wall biosynthesis
MENRKMVQIAILRREPGFSFSMDVYADGLVRGLKTVRPDWQITELQPQLDLNNVKGNAYINGLKKYYQRYWNYPNAAKHHSTDLFHVIDHSDGHLAYWLSKTGKPVVVTCHDLINFYQPGNIADQAKLPALSTAIWKYSVRGLRQADQIITVSDHTAKDVNQLLGVPSSQLTTVPNGFDSEFSVLSTEAIQTIRQKYQIQPQQFCLLHVGSNHPRKNILTVLKVLATLKEKGLSVQLLKAGEVFSSEQQRLIAEYQLADSIRYLGKPDKATLVQIYNAADALLSPSLSEGFGITILEAMACGTPVITSNVTSLPEVVGNGGILVSPEDVPAIVQAVCALIQDSAYRQTLIERGFARVKAFSWENTAEQVAQVYQNLLDL